MNGNLENIGLYIKKIRTEKELTLHQVAVGTDIDATIISKIERGGRIPTNEQLNKIANFFEIPIELLKQKTIAEKIIKEYGINETTFNAIQLVNEQFVEYKKQNKNE